MSTSTTNPVITQATPLQIPGVQVITNIGNSVTADELVLLLAQARAKSAQTGVAPAFFIERRLQNNVTRTPVGRA